jgi:alpha-1,2-mannosyltransferase
MDAVSVQRSALLQRAFWLVLLVIFAVVSISYTAKAMKSRSAFLRWRESLLSVEDTNIYQRFQYPNPPIMALLLRPLAFLEPPLAGALTWFLLKVGMAVFSLWAIFRLIEHGGATFPPWAKAVAVLLSLRPLIGDLTHGNVNIFILFLVIASLFAFHKNRDWLAGLLLALAVCCKVTPLLLVPYFAWKRQWKLLAGWAVGMGLFLFALPAAFLGWSENLVQLESWANQMVVPYVRDGVVSSEHPNQSLPGVVHRLLTHSPSFCEYPNGTYTPSEYHNFADIGRDGARWLARGAQALFALMVILLCRTPASNRGGWRLSLEFAIILVGMLIFSERTWKHHSVTLALPFAVLAYVLATRPLSKSIRAGLIASLVVSMGLMLSASGMLNTRSADLAQVYGVYLWAFLILLGALVGCRLVAATPQASVAAGFSLRGGPRATRMHGDTPRVAGLRAG